MKAGIIRLSAFFLLLWYSFSVIGFNVHTCNASGRSFVATFVTGLSCSDIHPGHVCEKGMCGAGHARECCHDHDCGPAFRLPDCCSNDHVALVITGCSSSEDHHESGLCGYLPHVGSFYEWPRASFCSCSVVFKPASGLIVQGDRQSLLKVWRI